MSKKKIKRKIFPTEFVLTNIKDYNSGEATATINNFLNMEDGSRLSEEHIYEISNLFKQYPNIMKLICCAYEEKGYDSF